MIIEFTGVPCSGKSDVSHELAGLLRDQGYTVCEKQYVLSHSEKSIKRILAKLTACFLFCIRHPKRSRSYYRSIGDMKLWMNYIYLIAHRCKKDICILEQGYLQFVGSFFDNAELDTQRMDSLFNSLVPQNEMVQIFVSATKETVFERAASREDKPFFMSAEDPGNALDCSFASCEALTQTWCNHKGKAKFIAVENEKDNAQHEVAKTILEIMKQEQIL